MNFQTFEESKKKNSICRRQSHVKSKNSRRLKTIFFSAPWKCFERVRFIQLNDVIDDRIKHDKVSLH